MIRSLLTKPFTMLLSLLIVLLLGSCTTNRESEVQREVTALRQEIAFVKQEISSLRDVLSQKVATQRWQIEMRNGVRADIYLLDTQTGRIWREYEDPKSKEMWWEESRVAGRDWDMSGQSSIPKTLPDFHDLPDLDPTAPKKSGSVK